MTQHDQRPVTAFVAERMPPARGARIETRTAILRVVLGSACLALILCAGAAVVIHTLYGTGFWGSIWRAMILGTFGLTALLGVLGVLAFRLQGGLHRQYLSRAQWDAGEDGLLTTLKFQAVTAWFSRECTLESVLLEQLDIARSQLAALIQEDVRYTRPLLVLCFKRESDFVTHTRRPWATPGTCDAFFPKRIVFGEDAAWDRLIEPATALRIYLTYHLLHQYKGFWPAPWVATGVANYLGCGSEPRPRCQRNRRIRLAAATGQLLDESQSFGLKPKDMLRKMRGRSELANFEYVTLFVDQAWSLAEYLCDPEDPGGRRTRFRAFLAGSRRFGRPDDLFQRHFGHGPDRLLHDWQRWALAQDIETAEPLPPEIQDALSDRVLPTAANEMAPIEKRVTAVRSMGMCGSVSGADTLIKLLRADNAQLRRESLWALQAMSGQSFGEHVSNWETWHRG